MKKIISIFINGVEHQIEKNESLSFEEVIKLAYGSYQTNDNIAYTVTYSRAHGNKKGLLLKGQSIALKEGMIFSVTCTNKS